MQNLRLRMVENPKLPEETAFSRQELTEGWNQDLLKNAKVLVVGAGALGNETIKNLSLAGIGEISIVDMDFITISNLSKTVLFTEADLGKNKAKIAANKAKTMSLLPKDYFKVSYYEGKVNELGTGIFREYDLVLGCVDNVETRLYINEQCALAKTPWIEAGTNGLAGHVTFFNTKESSHVCYRCYVSPTQLANAFNRYSCDNFEKSFYYEQKIPSNIFTTAIIAAIQVQEAIKYLLSMQVVDGKVINFNGVINDFDVNQISLKDNCLGHVTIPSSEPLNLSNSCTLRQFLETISEEGFSGPGATLDLNGYWEFVISTPCKNCSNPIVFNRPGFRITTAETTCHNCLENKKFSPENEHISSQKETKSTFSLSECPPELLDLSLKAIGVPFKGVLAVYNAHKDYKYYGLSLDSPFTLV